MHTNANRIHKTLIYTDGDFIYLQKTTEESGILNVCNSLIVNHLLESKLSEGSLVSMGTEQVERITQNNSAKWHKD